MLMEVKGSKTYLAALGAHEGRPNRIGQRKSETVSSQVAPRKSTRAPNNVKLNAMGSHRFGHLGYGAANTVGAKHR